MLFGKWRHLNWVIRDVGRLNQIGFHLGSKDLVDQFAFAHGGIYLNLQLNTDLPKTLFIEFTDIHTRIFLDRVKHGQSAIRAGKINFLASNRYLRDTMNGLGNFFK